MAITIGMMTSRWCRPGTRHISTNVQQVNQMTLVNRKYPTLFYNGANHSAKECHNLEPSKVRKGLAILNDQPGFAKPGHFHTTQRVAAAPPHLRPI